MKRKERREKARRRVLEIVSQLVEIISESIEKGRGHAIGFENARQFLSRKTKECPQEAHFYDEAAIEFSRRYNAAAKAKP